MKYSLGQSVRKHFPGHGTFRGVIEGVPDDDNHDDGGGGGSNASSSCCCPPGYYFVRYEDGDSEHIHVNHIARYVLKKGHGDVEEKEADFADNKSGQKKKAAATRKKRKSPRTCVAKRRAASRPRRAAQKTTTGSTKTSKEEPWDWVEPALVVFSHPGIEKDAFKEAGKESMKVVTDETSSASISCLDLELTLDDGRTWKGKGSVFGMPRGDQRYLIQTKALVVPRRRTADDDDDAATNDDDDDDDDARGACSAFDNQPELKLVRFAGEYAGFAEEIARSTPTPAMTLAAPWTRVMRPLLSSAFPLEAIVRDNDPFVMTAGPFRYGLCKQYSLRKMRNLPQGSIVLFSSLNDHQCYLDTVFVVGREVDVVDEKAWQESSSSDDGKRDPHNFCTLSRQHLSEHQGAEAWKHAIQQKPLSGQPSEDGLIDEQSRQVLDKLTQDFVRRDPDPIHLARSPKEGAGPLVGRLYWGKEYTTNDDEPFSFVPVWPVGKGQERCTEPDMMRPRPKIDLNLVYRAIGSKPPSKLNAQLVTVPKGIGNGNKAQRVFDEVRRQVERQGYDLGVRFAPPAAMEPEVENALSKMSIEEMKLCESDLSKRPIRKGRMLSLEGKKEVWKVKSLRMGPYIEVQSISSGKVDLWPSIGLDANICEAAGKQID